MKTNNLIRHLVNANAKIFLEIHHYFDVSILLIQKGTLSLGNSKLLTILASEEMKVV